MENKTEHLGGAIYRVKNQTGFNAALYDYFGAEEHKNAPTKKEIRKAVKDGDGKPNWPTKYPCTFEIYDTLFECGRIGISILDKLELDRMEIIKAKQAVMILKQIVSALKDKVDRSLIEDAWMEAIEKLKL